MKSFKVWATPKRAAVLLIVANELRGLCVAVPIAWAMWGR